MMLSIKHTLPAILLCVLLVRKASLLGCKKVFETWICTEIQLETNKKLPINEVNLNVKKIKLQNCTVPSIPAGVFTFFKYLIEMDLENSKIQNITPGAFDGLARLNKLHLRKNEIAEIKKNTLNVLSSITELNLHYNHISELESGCFSNMNQLEIMRLGWNHLKYIPENVFINLKKLKYLFLNDNFISQVALDGFKDLPSLYKLALEYNLITKLEFLKTIAKTSNLVELSLSFNNLSKIDEEVFSGFNNLNTLQINDNKLLSSMDFVNLLFHTRKLKKIALNNNLWDCNLMYFNLQVLKFHNVTIIGNNTQIDDNVNGIKCSFSNETTSESIDVEKPEEIVVSTKSITESMENIQDDDVLSSTTNYINYTYLKYLEEGFYRNLSVLIKEALDSGLKSNSMEVEKDEDALYSFGNGYFISICLIIVITILLIATTLLCFMCIYKCKQKRRTLSIFPEDAFL